jgi:hypothetical protein
MLPGGQMRVLVAVAACASALVAGCAAFVPDSRTPVDRARELDAKCKDVREDSAAPLLAPANVDAIEPAYAYVSGGPNGRDAHLRGARIRVKPLAGATRESLTRILQCHQAHVVGGSVAAAPGDPYSLPERWLAIDVESESDGFAVLVCSDDLADARRVLERARLFAGHRPSP